MLFRTEQTMGKSMRKEKLLDNVLRKTITLLLMVLVCGVSGGVTPADGHGNTFSMVLKKPKAPFVTLLIRDVNDIRDLTTVSIDVNSSLTQPFASIYLNTNITTVYSLYMRCTPFVMELSGGTSAYLCYGLAVYDAQDDSPVVGSPFIVGEAGFDSGNLLQRYKAGNSEEKVEIAKIAVQLLDVGSVAAGSAYQASVTFEVRAI